MLENSENATLTEGLTEPVTPVKISQKELWGNILRRTQGRMYTEWRRTPALRVWLDWLDNPTESEEIPYLEDVNGHNLLMVAIVLNKKDALEQLLKIFPMDKKSKSGNTALHFCAASGDLETAEKLLDHGADELVKNGQGLTPARIARDCEYQDLSNVLGIDSQQASAPPQKKKRQFAKKPKFDKSTKIHPNERLPKENNAQDFDDDDRFLRMDDAHLPPGLRAKPKKKHNGKPSPFVANFGREQRGEGNHRVPYEPKESEINPMVTSVVDASKVVVQYKKRRKF